MKKLLLLSTFFLLLLSCEQHKETDLSKSKLQGKIKSITTYTLKTVEESIDATNLNMQKERHQSYNIQGNLQEDIWYVSDETAFRTVKYKYDSDDKIQEHIIYNQDKGLEGKLIYEYDNNTIQKHTTYNIYGDAFKKLNYTYDLKGQLIQQDTYEGAGTQFTHTMKVENKYDGDGNKINKTIYRNGKLFSAKSTSHCVANYQICPE